MSGSHGVTRLTLELVLALAFAIGAMQVGSVNAEGSNSPCQQGLTALQIELAGTEYGLSTMCPADAQTKVAIDE